MPRSTLVSVGRAKRKKIFLRLSVYLLIIVFMAAGLVFSLFCIDDLRIQKISVEGENFLSEEELAGDARSVLSEKILGLIPRDRIFFFPEENLEASLMGNFSRLKAARVEDRFPSEILVQVEERTPVAVFCGEGGGVCFFVDETGFIFDNAPLFSSGIYLKFFDKQNAFGRSSRLKKGVFLLPTERFAEIMLFKNRVDHLFRVSEIHLQDSGVYEFYSPNGSYLILDEKDNWDSVFNNFEIFSAEILKNYNKDIDYIDLRFGNKIYYKRQQ